LLRRAGLTKVADFKTLLGNNADIKALGNDVLRFAEPFPLP
jgi:hypothetical protein